jgi:hypothetical protein
MALIRRYKPMFPDLAADELLARGCEITWIEFEDYLEAPIDETLQLDG